GEKLAKSCRDESSDGTLRALVQARLAPRADSAFQRTRFPSCQDDLFIVDDRSPQVASHKRSSEGKVDALILDIVTDGKTAAFRALMAVLDADGNEDGFYLCGTHSGRIDLKTLAPLPPEATA